jgi:nitrogen-specific signal transduction histidine kinase
MIKYDKAIRNRHTGDPLKDPAVLIDYVSDAIISTDTNNHIHSWNHGAENLLAGQLKKLSERMMLSF